MLVAPKVGTQGEEAGAMVDTTDRCSELTGRGACVVTRYDDQLCARVRVHVQDGLHAANSGARLVRQAVLDAVAEGARSVEMTLDVGSPVSGAVLEQLRDLAGNGVADLQARRAGSTVLVHARLVAVSPGDPRDARPDPVRARSGLRGPADRQLSRRPAMYTPPADLQTARRAQRRLRAELAGWAGVCGVGLARTGDGYVLRVNVTDAGVRLPTRVDGVAVETRSTGPVTAAVAAAAL